MKGWVEAFFIVGVSASLAWFAWFWHPDAPQFGGGGLEKRLEEALAWEKVVWVDARLREEFEAEHIPGATLLNTEAWEELFEAFVLQWDPDTPIVVYCKSQACLRSHEVAERLRAELGADNIFVLEDGWEAWLDRGGAQ